jgi:hypothetical protein
MAETSWSIEPLGDLAAPDDGAIAIGPFGSSMKSDVYVIEGVPVVRGTNLDGRPGFRGEFVFVQEQTADRFSRCLIEPGDLVFPHRGAIGSVGLAVDEPPGRWLLSTSMMKFRAHCERLDPLFAFHFFRSARGCHELLKNASQVGTPGIGQPLASLRACEIPVPPIDEQRVIASILGGLDDKIEQNRRTARALERLAGGLPSMVRGLRAGQGQGRWRELLSFRVTARLRRAAHPLDRFRDRPRAGWVGGDAAVKCLHAGERRDAKTNLNRHTGAGISIGTPSRMPQGTARCG